MTNSREVERKIMLPLNCLLISGSKSHKKKKKHKDAKHERTERVDRNS